MLAIVGVAQDIMDASKNTPEESNRYPKKGEPVYIRYIQPWMLEEKKGGVVQNTNDGKEYWWCKEHQAGKFQWVHQNPEDSGNWSSTSSGYGRITKSSI